ncbi:hypothetical protein SISSUDRAFT_1123824 [Sistotremastrum suecicum HHB10207 ss-3]|uniref:Protein kinase domain-containing protein n=1 Tax=Sistotremastrum suecicum HHB10207 ss-3 TaxID=1314776 RepID=A0A166J141_9AGAM|nr:hypothetical protein SISSUDRAFT_1123824 [Sistotremastrum suecicum HHB10207 ss-3]
MSFVKLSIFGTSFEVTTRYVDLQPVGMGAFGLVCKGSAHRLVRGRQENYEALQHPRPQQKDVSRAQAP